MKGDDRGNVTRLLRTMCCAAVVLCVGLLPSTRILAQQNADKTDKPGKPPEAAKPVATGNTEVAKLLREWFAEGTAAGNVGDWYDNRDGRHSDLGLSAFPQLRTVEITEAEREWARRRNTRPHWGLLVGPPYPHVTFGNSSTSGSPPMGCSNARYCILSTRATTAHYLQYVRNHLYIFPEHRDHDPGRNGRGGWGDLFHANIPYLIISQGSSGTDQPFMKAVAYTLAAFRPDVKKLLIEKGLLMPTVQYIFRRSNRGIATDEDYLSGAAHPSVFEGSKVDALAMVKLAHEMTADAVPPMIRLTVVTEDEGVVGRDYFEAGPREKVFDTPAAVARIGRSVKQVRRMVLSAKTSFDGNGLPLTWHWVVLRGDAKRVRVNRLSPDGSEVELLVPFHERMSVPGRPEIETNRVDVGAFVHNGKYYSAPGFVSYYFLDDEARTYADDGRVLEVAYGVGDTRIGNYDCTPGRPYDITDWKALLDVLLDAKGGLPSGLLRGKFSAGELKTLGEIAAQFAAALSPTPEQQKAIDEAEAAHKQAEDAADKAKKTLDEATRVHEQTPGEAAKAAMDKTAETLKTAQKEVRSRKTTLDKAQRVVQDAAADVMKRERPELGGKSAVVRIEDALNAIKDDVGFCTANAAALDRLCGTSKDDAKKKACAAARDELAALLKGRPADALTKGVRSRVEQLNIAVLQTVVYPGILNWTFRRNFVDPRIASHKTWRDVYHYDDRLRLTGWTRHRDGAVEDFTTHGHIVVEKDARGRPSVARQVKYTVPDDPTRVPILRQEPGETLYDYTYAGDDDRVGREVERPKPPEPEKPEAPQPEEKAPEDPEPE